MRRVLFSEGRGEVEVTRRSRGRKITVVVMYHVLYERRIYFQFKK